MPETRAFEDLREAVQLYASFLDCGVEEMALSSYADISAGNPATRMIARCSTRLERLGKRAYSPPPVASDNDPSSERLVALEGRRCSTFCRHLSAPLVDTLVHSLGYQQHSKWRGPTVKPIELYFSSGITEREFTH